MYVIVEINGQQFKAEEGKKLFVHHIQDAESGKTVEFEKVLLVDNNGTVTVGAPTVDGAKVVCEVVSPLVKGDKVLASKEFVPFAAWTESSRILCKIALVSFNAPSAI